MKSIITAVLLSLPLQFGFAASGGLEIVPRTFDFGWAPENSKITAEFRLKNTSSGLIPITDVQPSCGCTASHFTAGTLSSQDEMKIDLTFDTRGYQGSRFFKKTYVKTDNDKNEYEVFLRGHVTDPNAPLRPTGSGVAHFKEGDKNATQTLSFTNHSSNLLSIAVVQEPAAWAKTVLNQTKLKPGETGTLSITVRPPYDKLDHTSVTVEGVDRSDAVRMTLAVQTGSAAPRLSPLPKVQ